MANDATKVSVGKPKIGGAIFRAPLGTALPTDATTGLAEAFKCLGYVSDEGVTNSNNPESDEIKAWGGDIVTSLQTAKPDKWKLKLLESTNPEVLKTVYGDDNVTGDLNTTGIIVKANSKEQIACSYVVEMILKGLYLKRVVIPNATVSELADIVYADGEAVGYEVTLYAVPDTAGNTHYEYIQKSTTTTTTTNGGTE